MTGGSGGIGAELCKRLHGEGAAVAVHFDSNAAAAEAVVAAIAADGGRAVTLGADLRDAEAPAAGRAGRGLVLSGPIDVLAANAGIARGVWTSDEVDAAAVDELLFTARRTPGAAVLLLAPVWG